MHAAVHLSALTPPVTVTWVARVRNVVRTAYLETNYRQKKVRIKQRRTHWKQPLYWKVPAVRLIVGVGVGVGVVEVEVVVVVVVVGDDAELS